MKLNIRYAVVVILIWAVVAPAGALLIAINAINANNQKFCLVISPAIAVKVSPPADPKANVSQERTWEWYVRYQALSNSLGCLPYDGTTRP